MDEQVVDLGIPGFEQAVEIGRGGFSTVYRAWDPRFQRYVAIKVITAALNERTSNRFVRECAAIGALSGHPNIVTVHDSGRTARGEPYIVMEHLSGGSLAGRTLPWADAVAVGVQLAGALESAHRADVLHRDVKPDNVLRSQYGDVKLADFGIARIDGAAETSTGVVTASVLHAAPEVLDGQRPAVGSDVYSLASTVYALVNGAAAYAPYVHEGHLSLMRRIMTEPVPPLPAGVPVAVVRVVKRGLSKSAADRYPTAAAFGEDLRAAQAAAGVTVTALPLAREEAIADAMQSVIEQATTQDAPERTRPGTAPLRSRRDGDRGRRRSVMAGAVALAAVVAIVGALLARGGGEGEGGEAGSTSTSAPTAASTSEVVATTGSPGTTPATGTPNTTAAAAGVRLGPDLQPATTEPCRAPTTATGATWQLGAVRVADRSFSSAYYCNLFSGASGSLDFVLGNGYRRLRVTVGFADTSRSTSHTVRYEVIADGRTYLTDPLTVRFGESHDLDIDVSGVTQLKIRVTEQGAPGGNEAASQPVLGNPTLTR